MVDIYIYQKDVPARGMGMDTLPEEGALIKHPTSPINWLDHMTHHAGTPWGEKESIIHNLGGITGFCVILLFSGIKKPRYRKANTVTVGKLMPCGRIKFHPCILAPKMYVQDPAEKNWRPRGWGR